MSKPTSPAVPFDASATAETIAPTHVHAHARTAADVWTEPTSPGDAPPFESPEFGVGGFFPHVDDENDG